MWIDAGGGAAVATGSSFITRFRSGRGVSTVDNVHLRCRAHNAYQAELDYGREFVDRARKRSRPDAATAAPVQLTRPELRSERGGRGGGGARKRPRQRGRARRSPIGYVARLAAAAGASARPARLGKEGLWVELAAPALWITPARSGAAVALLVSAKDVVN